MKPHAKAKPVASYEEHFANQKNNLYVRGLPKHVAALEVRRMFARYGRISSFSLVDKPTFTTNIAYVGFQQAVHAKQCLESITNSAEIAVSLGC